MALRDKIIFWLLGLFSILWFLGSISSILMPFLSAIIIAYFLDPLADYLEKQANKKASKRVLEEVL